MISFDKQVIYGGLLIDALINPLPYIFKDFILNAPSSLFLSRALLAGPLLAQQLDYSRAGTHYCVQYSVQ